MALLVVQATAAAGDAAADPEQGVRPSMPIEIGDRECTLGFVLVDGRGKAKALTARHCGTRGQIVRSRDGAPVGVIEKISAKPSDIAQISVRATDPVYADVAGVGKVTEIIDLDTLRQIRPLICKKGATTALTCGPLGQVGEDYLSFIGTADHGDSGAPVYALTSNGTLMAAGILEGDDRDRPEQINATAVAPFAAKWRLKIAG